jgi:hypothetical protein
MGMPWEEFLDFYNKRENTSYATVKDWMVELYKAADGCVNPVAVLIGVSNDTMTRKLKSLGLWQKSEFKINAHRIKLGDKEKIYLGIPDKVLAELTKKQIIERCGCHIDTFTKMHRKYKRPYRKLVGGRKGKNV